MRKVALLLAVLLATACSSIGSTGVGRAASLAFSGVPPTVPTALDSIEAEYDRLSKMEMAGILKIKATTPTGIIKQENARADRQARIDATKDLFADLRKWIGVEAGAAPSATQDAAAKNRASVTQGILDKIAQMELEERAARAPEPKPEPDPPPPPADKDKKKDGE